MAVSSMEASSAKGGKIQVYEAILTITNCYISVKYIGTQDN